MEQVTKEQELLMNLLATFTQDKMLILMVMSALKQNSQIMEMIEWLIPIYQNKQQVTEEQIIGKMEQIISKMN